mmetsp:Transcript_37105/g.33374  ORF Transcript_37105/g.33374 Transcript_37105/m.33374 type:complete len:107 (+) Transcript_37105:1216-1536(+)
MIFIAIIVIGKNLIILTYDVVQAPKGATLCIIVPIWVDDVLYTIPHGNLSAFLFDLVRLPSCCGLAICDIIFTLIQHPVHVAGPLFPNLIAFLVPTRRILSGSVVA